MTLLLASFGVTFHPRCKLVISGHSVSCIVFLHDCGVAYELVFYECGYMNAVAYCDDAVAPASLCWYVQPQVIYACASTRE